MHWEPGMELASFAILVPPFTSPEQLEKLLGMLGLLVKPL
jgi:hypothetical protein